MLDASILLEAMNGIDEEQVRETHALWESREEIPAHLHRSVWRTVLIAAVIAMLLSVTAYAVSQFQLHHRPPQQGERYTVAGGLDEFEPLYVFSFDGPEECRAIHFKPTWTPSDDYWFWWPDEDGGWVPQEIQSRESWNDEYGIYFIDCLIEAYYAPQFRNGGHLYLSEYLPDTVTEEQWGEVHVLKFTGTGLHQIKGKDCYGNYLMLFHPDQGWVLMVCGHDSMENLEQIARGIQVEQTDPIIRASDYTDYNVFCDIHVG